MKLLAKDANEICLKYLCKQLHSRQNKVEIQRMESIIHYDFKQINLIEVFLFFLSNTHLLIIFKIINLCRNAVVEGMQQHCPFNILPVVYAKCKTFRQQQINPWARGYQLQSGDFFENYNEVNLRYN